MSIIEHCLHTFIRIQTSRLHTLDAQVPLALQAARGYRAVLVPPVSTGVPGPNIVCTCLLDCLLHIYNVEFPRAMCREHRSAGTLRQRWYHRWVTVALAHPKFKHTCRLNCGFCICTVWASVLTFLVVHAGNTGAVRLLSIGARLWWIRILSVKPWLLYYSSTCPMVKRSLTIG